VRIYLDNVLHRIWLVFMWTKEHVHFEN